MHGYSRLEAYNNSNPDCTSWNGPYVDWK